VTELHLIRHGETEWNRLGRYQGQIDVPLSDGGRDQAAALAEILRVVPLRVIYSSDLRRARQTAEAVARTTGAPVREDGRLREIRLGRWEGLTLDEIRSQDGQALEAFRRDPATARAPEGESVSEVQRRVLEALDDILRAFPEGPVAIVSHGLALAALKVSLLGQELETVWQREPANAAVEVFQTSPGIHTEF
jgi:alpha-ribazole phosphatase